MSEQELHIEADERGFTLTLRQGARKTQWDIDSGYQTPRDFAETLRDILRAVGAPIAEELSQGISEGLYEAPGDPKQPREADLMSQPQFRAALNNATSGGGWTGKGDDDPYWDKFATNPGALVDLDNKKAMSAADAAATSRLGADARDQVTPLDFDIGGRFQPKNSDHRR